MTATIGAAMSKSPSATYGGQRIAERSLANCAGRSLDPSARLVMREAPLLRLGNQPFDRRNHRRGHQLDVTAAAGAALAGVVGPKPAAVQRSEASAPAESALLSAVLTLASTAASALTAAPRETAALTIGQ